MNVCDIHYNSTHKEFVPATVIITNAAVKTNGRSTSVCDEHVLYQLMKIRHQLNVKIGAKDMVLLLDVTGSE
jgi:hypothetical protein